MIFPFVSPSGGNVFTRNVEVLISRPLTEVFAFVADALNRPCFKWEVTEREPSNRIAIESTTGPFPTTLAYQFAARDGGTFVDFAVTGRPSGFMRLLEPIARTTQKNLDRGFARLEDVLEAGAAS